MFVAFGLGASLTWYFRADVFRYLLVPADGRLSASGKPIFTGPTDMFSLVLGTVAKGGMVAAFPVLLYHAYDILKGALSREHRRTVLLFLILITLFYIAGTAFAYFVLLPLGLGFLLEFGTDIADPAIRITEYMELATAMLFWLGIVFELPIVMMLLAKLRLVSHRGFIKVRKYVPVAAWILACIITPTFDVVNMFLVFMPLIILYEVGVFLAWLVRPRIEGRGREA